MATSLALINAVNALSSIKARSSPECASTSSEEEAVADTPVSDPAQPREQDLSNHSESATLSNKNDADEVPPPPTVASFPQPATVPIVPASGVPQVLTPGGRVAQPSYPPMPQVDYKEATTILALQQLKGDKRSLSESEAAKKGPPKKKKRRNSSCWDEQWNGMYQRLVKYSKDHGNCLIPRRYEPDPKLGRWVIKQRENHTKNILSKERIELLESIGFVWCIKKLSEFDDMVRRLVRFRDAHGHCNIPHGWKDDKQLAIWVRTQRKNYKKEQLPQDRIATLESVGFEWTVQKKKEEFDVMFEQLIKYEKKHGHCSVPLNYKEDPKLARWVEYNKKRHKKNLLSEDRVEKLESIGFVWGGRESFDVMYDQLIKYKHVYGNCEVPREFPLNPKLARWVTNLRKLKKRGKLLPDQIEWLEYIGFEWKA